MNILPDIALFALICAVLAGAARYLKRPEQTRAEGIAVGAALGLGIFSVLTFLVSMVRINFYLVLALWGLAIFVIGRYSRRTSAPDTETEPRPSFRAALRSLTWLEWVLGIYMLVVFIVTLIPALAPPGGGDYDSLVYHLTAPRQYLHFGRIVQLAYDHHTYFPLGTEMLYMFGLWLRGPVLAKLFHWLMLPLCCVGLIAIGGRHISRRAGFFAAAIFASLPVVQSEASTAYIDLALSAFTVVTFLCFFEWMRTRRNSWFILAAAFCGFCLDIKYLGALTFGWLWLSAAFLMQRETRLNARALAAFAVLPLLVGGGWYLRNFFWTGNPVYPFAYEIFGGRGWSLERARAYTVSQKAFGFGHSPFDLLMLPWRLAMAPFNTVMLPQGRVGIPNWPFSSAVGTTGTGMFDEPGMFYQSILGPVLLALGVPALGLRGKPRIILFSIASIFFYGLFWAATGHYLRYLLPAYALCALVCGWAVDRFLVRDPVLRYTIGFCLTVWFALILPFTVWNSRFSFPYVFGGQDTDSYLAYAYVGYDAMHWASRNTPPDARFAVFGEPRCFYLDRDYFYADSFQNDWLDYGHIKSANDLVDQLDKLGATHILWDTISERSGGAGNDPPFIDQAVASGKVRQIYSANHYNVYELTDAIK